MPRTRPLLPYATAAALLVALLAATRAPAAPPVADATAPRAATPAPTPRAVSTPRPAAAPRAGEPRLLRTPRTPRAVEPERGFAQLRAIEISPRGGYLGLSLLELTPELRAHFGAPGDSGVLVSSVVADGPAAKAGVQVGDVLVGVDGEKVGEPWDVSRLVRPHEDGDRVELEVRRGGRALDLGVTVEERDSLLPHGEHQFRFLHPDPQGARFERFVAPECAELGQRLGDCVGEAAPEWTAKLRERRGELEERVVELEKRLKDLESQLEKLNR